MEPDQRSRGARILADRDSIGLAPAVDSDLLTFRTAIDAAAEATTRMERDQHLDRAISLYQGPLLEGRHEDWVLPLRDEYEKCAAGILTERRDAAIEEGDPERALDLARRAAAIDPYDEPAHATWFRLLSEAGREPEARRLYEALAERLRVDLDVDPEPDTEASIRSRPGPSSRRPAAPRNPAFRVEDGATFCLAAIELHGRGVSALQRTLQGCGPRALLASVSDTRKLVGFFRVPEAIAAITTFRKLDAATARKSRSEPATIALDIVDATFRDGQFHGERIAALLRTVDVTRPGRTVATPAAIALSSPHERFPDRDLASPSDLGDSNAFNDSTKAERSVRTNVARHRSRFFGRETELEKLRALVASGAPLITLQGVGGTGKTRLARELARRVDDIAPGGAWFVGLEATRDPSLVLQRIADELGVPRSGEWIDAITQHLSAEKSVLILDNLEQILPDAAPVLSELTRRLERTVTLVTSRRPVSIEGEQRFPLAPLPVPETNGFGKKLSESPSVQLFLDRAREHEPEFQLTPRNASAIADLVRHLEGLPLALELAAARVSVLSPADILRRFQRRIDLADAADERPERHRTMSGVIDWSYRMLDKRTKQLFVSLSVFRGGFDLGAAEVTSNEALAGDLLAELVDSSLVVSAFGERPRFRLLETVRVFAEGKMSAAHHRRVSERHAEHFTAVANQYVPKLTSGDEEIAVETLDREAANIRAALEFRQSTADRARSRKERTQALTEAIQLADRVAGYWAARGRPQEGFDAFADLLEDTRGVDDRWVGRALFQAGSFAEQLSLSDECEDLLSRAAETFRAGGFDEDLARTLNSLGIFAINRRRFEDAEAHFRSAKELFEKVGNRRTATEMMQNLGSVFVARGDTERARAHLVEVLELMREFGTKRSLAITLSGLGNVSEQLKDYKASRAYHEECLALFREVRDEASIGIALSNLGHLAGRENDLERALRLLVEAAEVLHEAKSRTFFGNTLLIISQLPQVESYAEWVTPITSAGPRLMESFGVRLDNAHREGVSATQERLRDVLGEARYLVLINEGDRMTVEEVATHVATWTPQ